MLRIAPTTLRWEVDLGVDDYRKKQTKKAETIDPAFALGESNIVLFLKALFEIWGSDSNAHSGCFLLDRRINNFVDP
jgi:hypothetical protein